MKWDRDHRSSYVDDRRGAGGGTGLGGSGGISLLFFLFQRFGIAGVVVGILLFLVLRAFGDGGQLFSSEGGAPVSSAMQDEEARFVGFVLDDVQSTFDTLLEQKGERYVPARLQLFTSEIQSACGWGAAATGPFYCPGDGYVYIDLSFYEALRSRLGAPGDFAQAYVIAHEIGHHVQNLEGGKARRARGEGADGGSVRTELQADCYAGVWAHSANARQLLEIGDVEEALRAAEAIGDDTLQRKGGGVVQPESFTHGTSAQRMHWFTRGFETGSMSACDTFATSRL